MTRRSLLPPFAMALCLFLAAGAAPAQTELTGQTQSGAHYRIVVPDGWTPPDGLVIWNHGFSLAPVGPVTDLGPLADLQLSEGYAVAASSYSQPGWALFETVDNNREMVEVFEDEFGVPAFILLNGASLGGIVTAQAIEEGDLGNVIGAYPICGALAGSRVWDGGFDLRLLYDYVCGEVPGAAIPGGPEGLPFPPDPDFGEMALALAVNACTGVLLPPAVRTLEQSANLERLLDLTQIPEDFLIPDMVFVTFGLSDLVHDPGKLNLRQALGNANVDYGDEDVNEQIQRVQSDPYDKLFFRNHYTPAGAVGDVKIVSIHTDKDGLVLVENEKEYADVVPAANLSIAVAVEDVPSHCDFTEAEAVAGWESLRGWLAGAQQPDASSIQSVCESLVLGGLAQGPCRFSPSFAIPDLDGRVRPRNDAAAPPCTPDDENLCLNDDRFRVHVDWTDFQGGTGVGHTIPQTVDTGTFWFFNPDNYELMVKVLDGRTINDHFWVFYGALTNVEFTLTVTDTLTGDQKIYFNPSRNFASRGDTLAFPQD